MRVRVCNNAIPPPRASGRQRKTQETLAIHGSRELKIWGQVSRWQPSVHPGRGKREAPDGALTAKGRGVRRPEAADPARGQPPQISENRPKPGRAPTTWWRSLSHPQESRPEHKLKQTFQRNCNKSFYLFVNMVCGNFSAVYCAQIWWCQVQTLAVVHACHCSLIGLLMWLSDFCISS